MQNNQNSIDNKENKKTVRIFAWASFLNDMGSDIIYPVWPLFVTEILKANMAVLGLVDGLGEAIVSIAKALSGYWSDRIRKRKGFIWSGYLMGAASRIGYAISTVWQHLIPFRILDRAGKIRGAPRDAIIADVSTNDNRGKNFGLMRMADHSGAVVGILICLALFEKIGYRSLFMLAAIPSLISVLLILIKIKEPGHTKKVIYKGMTFRDLDRNFILYMVLSGIFAVGNFTYSFLLIRAKQIGFKEALVPVLYLVYTLSASLTAYPFGRLADRIGRKTVMQLSFLLWGLVCLDVIFFQSKVMIFLMFIIYGLHKGAIEPVQSTIVSELAPEKYRASSLGAYQMLIGLCALPASLIAGFLWDKIGSLAPFYLSLGLTVIASALMIFVKESKTATENS
ncbi:MAG TPA: MFS transporter [Candidatus Marinimicrobia bacterium]|nr:MFS transporter [Candidatus Neomarinimicrobiota bacterium]HRS52631.1 MFS transporter [Candidatus Neomarinimicrobiota bacterium]HRU92093.1 MFS transporter [Candidatus Neomarinimicrobiota bacterium]